MRRKETALTLQTIVNLPNPDYEESISNSVAEDRINCRRKRVNQLRLRGYTNEEIASITGYSLSSIEKDLHRINESSRQWVEEESIKEFCQSLHDSIILCDNAIEDLQILYTECDDIDSKLRILSKISEFEERKTVLYLKTKSVNAYFGDQHVN